MEKTDKEKQIEEEISGNKYKNYYNKIGKICSDLRDELTKEFGVTPEKTGFEFDSELAKQKDFGFGVVTWINGKLGVVVEKIVVDKPENTIQVMSSVIKELVDAMIKGEGGDKKTVLDRLMKTIGKTEMVDFDTVKERISRGECPVHGVKHSHGESHEVMKSGSIKINKENEPV